MANFLLAAINLLSIIITVDVVLSWIPEAREAKWAEPFISISAYFCNPIRKLMPQMPIDISPLVVILLLNFLGSMVMSGGVF